MPELVVNKMVAGPRGGAFVLGRPGSIYPGQPSSERPYSTKLPQSLGGRRSRVSSRRAANCLAPANSAPSSSASRPMKKVASGETVKQGVDPRPTATIQPVRARAWIVNPLTPLSEQRDYDQAAASP